MAMIMPQPLISTSWLKKAFAMRTLLPVGLFVHPRAQVGRIIIEGHPDFVQMLELARV